MKKAESFLTIAAATLVSLVVSAQEQKLQRSDLPASVEKTVRAQSQGAVIRGFSKEQEDGKVYYEVALVVKGHSREVQIDANGNVTEIEEEVRLSELPADARTALTKKAGNGSIIKVESLTKNDKLVAYEAQVMTNGKKTEIQVSPDGKPLDHEE